MTTYKSIIGKDINSLTTDPDNAQAEGQIWYNSTSNVFKDLLVSEAWSASGGLGSGRYALGQGTGGTVNAGIAVFGRKAGPAVNSTEEYNGSGWSTGGDGNTARYGCAKFGTQTAAVAAGGKVTVPSVQNVEEYNGTSWSEETDYPSQARQYLSGFGTLTAGVICGGHNSGTFYGLTDEYDGTNWTTGGVMNNVRSSAGTTGILTAGLIFGGQTPSITAKTEEYNGTAWTESGDMSTARSHLAGSGTQDAALAYGGFTPPSTTQTEAYNGSTWSTSPATLATATARNSSVGSGASTGLSFGGNPPGTTATEEYNRSANVITGAVFSSGGTANTARRQLGYTTSGTQNSCMGYGGFSPGGFINNSETYNGTSWAEGNNLNDSKGQLAGAGTATAALAFGGNSNNANTEEYNGTSWSEQNNMNVGRYELGGCGLQTAGLACGGDTSPPGTPTVVNTEEYDGTNWTTGGNLNTARRENDAAGSQTAAIVAGGGTPSGTTATESYNGTAWTTVNSKIRATVAPRTMGGLTSQTAAVTNGGHDGSAGIVGTEQWNGTNFITGVNMAQQRFSQASDGSISAGIVFMGDSPTPARLKTSEEYNGETVAANYKTLSSS